jgi:hypothetical protein
MLKSLISKGLTVPHRCENCYSAFTTLLVRYNLENDEGTWKIAQYRTIKNLVRR